MAQREIGSDELRAAYAWPVGPWLRAMMLTTLDGATAGSDGLSGSISSPTDRAVLSEVRREADAILIGAGTLRAERYNPVREREGRAPVLCIASASLNLPWGDPVFAESLHAPLVLTSSDRACDYANVTRLPDTSPTSLVRALHQRGLDHIVCEGGARLLTQLTAANLVDEYDITLAPVLAGNGHGIVDGDLGAGVSLRLAGMLTDGQMAFTRYVRT